MKYCDLTFATPEENLACDEALLDAAEEQCGRNPGEHGCGILRFWESSRYFVALGYGKVLLKEVNVDFCRRNAMPILRRCTGGGTVLQGPGVLNYALIIPIDTGDAFETISSTNQFVMQAHRAALSPLLESPAEVRGHTDLAIGGLKFSGNAQRRRKHCLLFHGSILLHLDFDIMEQALPIPSIQPAYRSDRRHREFLMNLKIEPGLITHAFRKAWQAHNPLEAIPYEGIENLVRDKYLDDEWNARM